MNVLIIEAGKEPYTKNIPNTLDAMHEVVDGYIEAIYPFPEPVAVVCNEEGKLREDTLWNRCIPEIHDIIKGTFFICGLGEDDFTDLPDDLAEKYMERFRCPEMFIPTPDGLIAIALK